MQNNILTRYELERIAKQPVIFARLLGKTTLVRLINTGLAYWQANELIEAQRRKIESLENHLNG